MKLWTMWKKTCRSPEIPRYGPVFFQNTGKSESIMFHETRRFRRVSGTVFSPIRTFSVAKENPVSGHFLATRRVKARKLSYSSRFATNNGVPQASSTDQVEHFYSHPVLFMGFWPKFHGFTSVTRVRYPKFQVRDVLISDISWYVKCHLRFPFRIFHGTWSVTRDSPLGYFYGDDEKPGNGNIFRHYSFETTAVQNLPLT